MFGLMAEGEDPRDYGFEYRDEDLGNSKSIMVNTLYSYPEIVRRRWRIIKARFMETGNYKNDKRINWIYTLDLYAELPKPSLLSRAKRWFSRLIHKFF